MTSHFYEIRRHRLFCLGAGLLVVLAAFALLTHTGAWLKWWPAPRPTLDVDRTILLHQVHAASSPQGADVVLIGDSSCLMNVSARRLEELLPGGRKVLNLGTVSYLDLKDYAQLLRRYVETNPGKLKLVVLLMHPEALRRAEPNPVQIGILRAALSGREACDEDSLQARLNCWLGLEIFRGRLLARAVPAPLPGRFGARYGFSSDLWKHLSAYNGSAFDPADSRPVERRIAGEYRLSPRLREASMAFRAAVPNDARLLVGITPCAESFVAEDHRRVVEKMLSDWAAWLQADATLTGLPVTLPDDQFARPAGVDSNPVHLNEQGNQAYTELLAQVLGNVAR